MDCRAELNRIGEKNNQVLAKYEIEINEDLNNVYNVKSLF